ncbi:MAG: glutamine--fructose-6-phosphate transaminase (isomerizing) [Candidatus Kerfeldbacteria bacterium]|nr:glutamine--fructose-6-phosphate transaminase (isomerizing) [Candidatus Kerfeldbacteria bacterium]
MCGIIGYIGPRTAVPFLLEGLRRMEYRGYDSAGVAVNEGNELVLVKRKGPVEITAAAVIDKELKGTCGIAHTRWATHGKPNQRNAHPHADCSGQIAVVHNGMLANYKAIKEDLERRGHRFRSDTDTEVISHLVEQFRSDGDSLVTAVQKTALLIRESAFAFAVIDSTAPDEIVAARLGSDLFIGLANGGLFVASDTRAFRAHTDKYVYVKDGHVAVIRRDASHQVLTFENEEVLHAVEDLWYELGEIEKGKHPTFMHKEIHEQGEVIRRVLEGRFTEQYAIHIGGIARRPEFQHYITTQLRRVLILGCGTSKFAGLAIARYFEEFGYPSEVIDAAEFATSYRHVTPETLVVPISQSGTTADVLEAMERLLKDSAVTFSLVNVPGSTLSLYGNGVYTRAGLETAVASTKAYTAQILSGCLLTLAIARSAGRVTALDVQEFGEAARRLTEAAEAILKRGPSYEALGSSLAKISRMVFLGRGYTLAAAHEGALKMLEVAYISALEKSAAEMKHGPLALVDKRTVVIAMCLPDPKVPLTYDRTIDNVGQILSRGGRVIAIAEEGDERIAELEYSGTRLERIIRVPATIGPFSAITAVLPLQLLAHGAAAALGRNIDQPRHLAKSVTVK